MKILPTFAIGVSVALVLFSLYTAAFGVLPDVMQRGIHLSLALLLVYLHTASAAFENGNRLSVFVLLGLAILGLCAAGYQVVFYDAVVSRYGAMTDAEIVIAAVAVIILLDATRRTIGWSMVVLALVFLAYAFWGNLLWGDVAHRGYDLKRVLSQVFLGADGIFGTPLGVSATFVVLIVILGALLEGTGASGVLMDIAVAMTGRSRGGPAKAAVVGSSLMGMISGTAVANVLTTGTISIPLMKRSGYKAHVAGAIEAVAALAGREVAEIDPELGANLMVFFCADWDEIADVPNLDRLIPDLAPLLDRLRGAEANQYRVFRFDNAGAIRAAGAPRDTREIQVQSLHVSKPLHSPLLSSAHPLAVPPTDPGAVGSALAVVNRGGVQ